MSKKTVSIIIIFAVSCGVFITSCYKVTTLVIPNTGEEITRTVSLSSDIIPVFAAKCSISGCHNTGGIKPDLFLDKAYNSLINGNYVNLSTPENSEIYLWLTGKRSTAMPVGGPTNPSNINQFILAWIKQGAKNN